MSESHKRNRSDYWAGLCVLGVAVLVLGLTVMLGYFRAHPLGMIEYNVVFDLANGVEGVKPGSRIYYGGIDIGQVEDVKYQDDKLHVQVAIDRNLRLHPGVQVRRAGSLIGGASSLIVSVIGDVRMDPLRKNSRIFAAPMTKGASNLLGNSNATRLERIQTSISEAWLGLEKVQSQFGEIGDASHNLSLFVERVRGDTEVWSPQIERIENQLNSYDPRLQVIQSSVDPVSASAQKVAEIFSTFSKHFTGPRLDQVQSNIDEMTPTFRELAKKFEEDVLPQIQRIMKKAEASSTQLLASVDELKKLAADGRKSIDTFIANSTLASQQLVLTESEVIGTLGLDLLQRPSAEDEQLLIREEAMREWTQTALNLRELLNALETMSIENKSDAAAKLVLKRLLSALRGTLAEYEQAQQRLFKSASVNFGTK